MTDNDYIGSGGINFTDEFAKQKAERLNCDILYSDDKTLLLDIDSDDDMDFYNQQMDMLIDSNLLTPWYDHAEHLRSKSGKRHIVIHLKLALPLLQRIMLQALLGSDRRRELLTWMGSLKGQQNPCLLFRPRVREEEALVETQELPPEDDDLPF